MTILRAALGGVLILAALPALAARDVLLVLDNSGSMRRNDPTRLAAPAVAEFIRAQPRDTRVGIILFTAEPELVLPLTPADIAADGEAARALARFAYRGQWTQTAGAIERALYELRTEGRVGARRAIVLMTDGLIDTGEPARDAELNRWLREDLAAQSARDRIEIFGIAFTERADYRLLQSLAATTGGDYFRVLAARDIPRALERIETVLRTEPVAAADAATPPAPAAPQAPPAETAPPEDGPPDTDGPGPLAEGWPTWAGGFALFALAAALAWLWRAQLFGRSGARRAAGGPLGVLYDSAERHELGERPVVIGRAGGNDPGRQYVIVPEKTVGRWHATIERRGQTFWLRDEGSVNGTFLNGERVIGERPLKHRDELRIHTHTFAFEIPELADADRTMLQGAPRLNHSGA